MKIDNNGSDQVSRARLEGAGHVEGARPGGAAPAARSNRDELALSDKSQLLSRARAEYAALPEIREARVVELRESIQGGRYQVPHEQLASRLLAIV